MIKSKRLLWLAAVGLAMVHPTLIGAYQSQTSSHIWEAADVDGQGNPIVAGYDFQGPAWIAQLDSQLHTTSSKSLSTAWNARMGLVHDSLGNFYVANVSSSLQVLVSKISPDFQTIQTSAVSGFYISNTVYNGLPLTTDIAIDAQDRLYVAGQTLAGQAALAELNTSLQVLNIKTIAGSGSASDRANRVMVDPSGTIYLTGRIASGTDYHLFVAKLNSNLTILSSSTLAVPASEGFGIRTDASGSVWLAGAANASYSACQPWIGRLNASLVIQSSSTLPFQGAFFDVWPVDAQTVVASGGLGSGAQSSTWIGRMGSDLVVQESFTGQIGYVGSLTRDGQGNFLAPNNNVFNGALYRYQKQSIAPVLQGTAVSNSSVRWSWSASLSPDGYRLLSSTGSVILNALANGTTNVLESNLAANTLDQRSLLAVGLLGSTTSTVAGVYTLANTPLSPTVAITTGPARLQWSSSGNPSGTLFHADLSTSPASGFTEFYAGTSTIALSATLPHNVTTYFRVRAENGDGLLTAYSVTVSTRITTNPPLAPTNAAGTALNASSIQWTWNDHATNETGYSIRCVSDGTLLAGSLPAGSTTWLETTLSPNTSVQIAVSAFNDDWVSTASTAATVYTGAATPAGTSVQWVSASSASISWLAQGNPVGTPYRVEMAGPTLAFSEIGRTPVTSLLVGALLPGTTYFFRVRAENGNGVLSAYDVTVSTFAAGAAPAAGVPITALAPTLSLPSRPLTRQDVLVASFPEGYAISSWHWTFNSVQGLSNRSTRTPVGAAGNPLAFKTDSSRLPLASLLISPGSYRLSVQAEDTNGQLSRETLATVDFFESNLASVSIYPNPWRADRDSGSPWITFSNIPAGASIKIYTLSGFWVQTLSGTGTSVDWHLDNSSGSRVASGLYFYVIDDGQGDRIRGKLSIIR